MPGVVAEDVGERTPGGDLNDGDQSDEYREHGDRPDADSSPGDRAASDLAQGGIARTQPRGGACADLRRHHAGESVSRAVQ